MKNGMSNSGALRLGRIITYIILGVSTLICIFPFLWMVSSSFKTTAEAYRFPPSLLPDNFKLDNYIKGWAMADFGMFTRNTLFLTIVCTVGTVVSAAVVAYGFAKFRARLSKPLFGLLMATMMLPYQVTLVPQYMLYYNFGMVDSYWPLIIPACLGSGAYNIFLYYQFFRSLPQELNEAAIIDGANSFQTFYKIMLPAVKPVAIAVGVMSLVYNWNDFFTPLIYLNSNKKFTIAIGLQFFNSAYGETKIGQMMAVSVVTMLPVLIIFFVCQKYFIQGIKMSGIKD